LDQLTFDHSLVWELMAGGQLSREDIANDIRKNIILRSLGPNAEVKVDLEGPYPLAPGDVFLLCSDGLSGQVSNEQLAMILQSMAPHEAVQALIDLANLRGGPDNITAIIVRIAGQSPSEAPAARRRLRPSWIGAGLLAVLSAALFAAQKGSLGLISLTLAALTAAIGAVAQAKRDAVGIDRRAQLGKGPYATAIASPDAAFLDDLKRLLQQLREAAASENWIVDWGKINACASAADEAAARKDFAAAIRESCRALCDLMAQLRSQGKSPAEKEEE
jgi:protein phosphatase